MKILGGKNAFSKTSRENKQENIEIEDDVSDVHTISEFNE
jgi:hypothetical protein